MVTLSDARIDELIAEDVPYIDLTSHILGVDTQAGAMEYFTREACVLAGGEVASRIATKLGCVVTNLLPDGTAEATAPVITPWLITELETPPTAALPWFPAMTTVPAITP